MEPMEPMNPILNVDNAADEHVKRYRKLWDEVVEASPEAKSLTDAMMDVMRGSFVDGAIWLDKERKTQGE